MGVYVISVCYVILYYCIPIIILYYCIPIKGYDERIHMTFKRSAGHIASHLQDIVGSFYMYHVKEKNTPNKVSGFTVLNFAGEFPKI